MKHKEALGERSSTITALMAGSLPAPAQLPGLLAAALLDATWRTVRRSLR